MLLQARGHCVKHLRQALSESVLGRRAGAPAHVRIRYVEFPRPNDELRARREAVATQTFVGLPEQREDKAEVKNAVEFWGRTAVGAVSRAARLGRRRRRRAAGLAPTTKLC